MSYKSPRYLKPGQWNLFGKKSGSIRLCSRDIYNYKEENLKKIHEKEMIEGFDNEKIDISSLDRK